MCCINSRVGYTGGETASAATPMGASASKTDFIVEVYAPEKAPVKSGNKKMKMKMTFNKKKKLKNCRMSTNSLTLIFTTPNAGSKCHAKPPALC